LVESEFPRSPAATLSALVGGGLIAATFLDFALWPLAWFAFVPILVALERPMRARRAIWLGLVAGMATNVPPHNLGEVCDALVALIDNPDLTVDDLMRYIPGPDFPTAGFICGQAPVREAYHEGRGILAVRARAEIETDEKSGRSAIIVTEIPYQVNKARLVERIAELVNERKLDGISDLRDESDRDGMRVVIELKRDAVPEVLLNQLYKHTPMQESFGVNMLAIVEGRPRLLTLKDALRVFLDHRRNVVARRTAYDLRQAEARLHRLVPAEFQFQVVVFFQLNRLFGRFRLTGIRYS